MKINISAQEYTVKSFEDFLNFCEIPYQIEQQCHGFYYIWFEDFDQYRECFQKNWDEYFVGARSITGICIQRAIT